MNYEFKTGDKAELQQVYDIISRRIDWMDKQGIRQWNVTDYWDCYPKSYYEKAAERKNLYVLKKKDDGKVVGTAVLYEQDERWEDNGVSAYYVHHLATVIGERGAGKAILQHCLQLAKEHKKEYLRLDCDVFNEKLNRYYDSLQFNYAGICVDGKYTGNRREKRIERG